MKNLLTFALLLTSQLLLAQGIPKGTGKIAGIVLDSASHQPVPFATIALISLATQKPVDGAVCDDKGLFTLNKIPAGEYKISVSFIGYKTVNKAPLSVAEKGTDLNTGTILLASEAKQLKEVTVIGQKELIEEKVDRTVYNAEQDATAKGGDATDVLRRVPMLSVDLDGNVSLRGNQNIKVLINNKPSTITAGSVADALKQIPSDMIKAVEVITSPSAKYDAEGSGGIINIILKKNTLEGFSLNADLSAGYRGSNVGLNGSYRKGKSAFSLGGFGRGEYNVTGSFDNTQVTKSQGPADEPIQLTTRQQADTRSRGIFGRYTAGWDYEISKNNSLSASVQYGLRNRNSFQDGLLTQTSQDATPKSSSLRDVNTKDLSGNVDASVNFTHTFAKPQQEFSLLTLYSRNDRTNDFTNNFLLDNGLASINKIKNSNKSINQEITLQADYQTPIGKTQLLEMGGKQILRRVTSTYTYFTDSTGNGFVQNADPRLANVFDYDQNVTAGYFSYTLNTAQNYSFKAGTRYEYTTINARFKEGSQDKIPSYGVLVPSINISRRLKKGTAKLAYNRRIQRPSIQFLNPNIQAANPLSITVGNPNLEPEYTNNFELGYSTFFKATSLNFSSFVRNTNNAIQSVRDVQNGNVIRTTYQNIGRENAYGFSLFANVNIGNKFSLNGGGDMYFADLKNNVPDPLYNAGNQGWVYSFRLFGGYNFSRGWGLQFFSFYRGKQVQLQGIQGGFGVYSVSLRKEFNEKKGSVGVGMDNFFSPSFRIPGEINSPVITQRSLNVINNLGFKITFSYRLGKLTMDGGNKRKKSVNNDDLKDGGGDGGGGNSGGGDAGGGQARPQPGTRPAGQQPAGMPANGQKPAGMPGNGTWNRQKPGSQQPGKDSTRLANPVRRDSTGADPAKPVRTDTLQPAFRRPTPAPKDSLPPGSPPPARKDSIQPGAVLPKKDN
jgi:outer membrane receptor protein involved in Fe transport